jgi:hypothetical protein
MLLMICERRVCEKELARVNDRIASFLRPVLRGYIAGLSLRAGKKKAPAIARRRLRYFGYGWRERHPLFTSSF